ncbi:MAG: type I restriction enzyme HsdR N-terminal domain-containing protein [Acidobacteria bacterium]|nr:type I restriction enzyme HsdR N-terminal domain-containing protein [Acidobacteriota bacterium]MCA1642097.1 type I restriction enzyme HsdR N-terminal domain-containing protein [Acidobacteriota bacterium]
MPQVPNKVAERLAAGIKRFQPILASAKSRDVGESDTVIIVTDMLSEVFGYDKYSEITSETSIRGTWCDLAIKLDGAIEFLIEVKSIGTELKEAHTKQAVDYSANQGTDWVILTNGETWRIYKVTFAKPIGNELVLEINFSQLAAKKSSDIDLLYTLTREGWLRSALGEFHTQQQALSRFFIGAMVVSQPILDVMRRELRRLSPDVKVDTEQIKSVLMQEVLKREVVEGEKFDQARKKITKAATKSLRAKPVKERAGQSKTSDDDSAASVESEEKAEAQRAGVDE